MICKKCNQITDNSKLYSVCCPAMNKTEKKPKLVFISPFYTNLSTGQPVCLVLKWKTFEPRIITKYINY